MGLKIHYILICALNLFLVNGNSPFKISESNFKRKVMTTTTLTPLIQIPKLLIDMQESINPFEVIYQWRYLDFEYPTYEARQRALMNG